MSALPTVLRGRWKEPAVPPDFNNLRRSSFLSRQRSAQVGQISNEKRRSLPRYAISELLDTSRHVGTNLHRDEWSCACS
jgi:hypothetical protein